MIDIRLEAIAIRLETIFIRLDAIAICPMDPHTEPEKVIGDYLFRRQEGPIDDSIHSSTTLPAVSAAFRCGELPARGGVPTS